MNKKQTFLLLGAVIVLASVFFFFRRFEQARLFSERHHKLEEQLKLTQKQNLEAQVRGPNQGTEREGESKMALVPSKKIQKPTLAVRGFKLPIAKSKAQGVFTLGRGKYGLLADVRALPINDGPVADQFNQEDIYGEYARHLIINKEALGERIEGKPVVINTHNKRMGIVTGMVSVTFHDFKESSNLLGEVQKTFTDLGLSPKKDFSHLKLSMWEAGESFDLAKILELEQWLKDRQEVKKARVEVIESLKVGQ